MLVFSFLLWSGSWVADSRYHLQGKVLTVKKGKASTQYVPEQIIARLSCGVVTDSGHPSRENVTLRYIVSITSFWKQPSMARVI